MKWGRNKSSPSSRRTSIIATVFPVSLFSMFKQKGRGPDTNSAEREKLDLSTPKERFYSMGGDEAYWRLSFGEERIEGRRSTGGINPLWYDDSGEEELQVPIPSFKNLCLNEMEVPKTEDYRNFNDMVVEIKNRKDKQLKDKKMPDDDGLLRRKKVDNGVEVTNLRRKAVYGRKSRCQVFRAREAEVEPDDGADDSSKPVERVIFAIEPEITAQRKDDILNSPVCDSRKQHPTSPIDSKWEDLEEKEYKEINVKTEPRTKSACSGRELDNRKVRDRNRVKAYSPRTECKIRELEEMRKARMRLKKNVVKEPSVFDSFAVVKSSLDPYRDFRDSMVEMIMEKGITSAEDLEELLVCYLTLNRDEYHDLIVKVFKQVWFELN